MTDMQLLDAAAKAAGYTVEGLADKCVVQPGCRAGGLVIATSTGGSALWNPLNDDGDALRLECEVGLDVSWFPGSVQVGNALSKVGECRCQEYFHMHLARHPDSSSQTAARRRATVRAAALLHSGA
jgi:hypothetical protein